MQWKQILTLAVVPWISVTSSAFAAPQEGNVAGWHVVRPGENLEIITNYYLGDPAAWPENAALNPGVNDPHLIFPGQRIRVLLSRGIPAGSAQVTDLGKRVDQQPTPIDWRSAQQQDLLRERDGVRTGSDSSAQLRFADGTQVTVGEDSLLFLRGDSSLTRPLSRDPQEVEIVVGQADLAASAVDRRQPPVEVTIGKTTAKPKPTAEGAMATRARKPESGGAQVMVFEGESTVAAAGAVVALASGMGTVVPDAGPPAPPQRLLSAPSLNRPTDGLQLDFANPYFSWEPVEGAVGYVLDVCGDPDCGELLVREAALTQPSWQAPAVTMGERYWRVSAVADSGLDGQPSAIRSLSILSERVEKLEPTVKILADGTHAGLGPALVLAEATLLRAEFNDPSGASYLEPTLDGEPVTMEAITSGWELGNHTIGGTLVSGQGDRLPIEAVPFIYDTVEPEIDWHVGPIEQLSQRHGLDQGEDHKKPKRKIKTHSELELLWSVDGIIWLPLLPPDQEASEWDIHCDTPQFFVWTREDHPFGADPALALEKGDVMRVEARDVHSAIAKLTLQTKRSDQGGFEISLEASDLVGNTSTSNWQTQ